MPSAVLGALGIPPALTLAGGLALKWAVTYAGRVSAADPSAAREATPPITEAPGWTPLQKRDLPGFGERPL